MRGAALLAMVVILAACGSSSAAVRLPAAPSPSAQSTPTQGLPPASPSPVQSGAAVSPTPAPSPPPAPIVACKAGSSPSAMVMLGGGATSGLIYDVGDPLHPKLVCSFSYTSAHLFTGDTFAYLQPVGAAQTQIVLHSIGSGNESTVATLPFQANDVAWSPQGGLAAYTVFDPQPDPNHPAGVTHVWLFSQGHTSVLFSFGMGIGDCICRYGLPPEVLSLSPDGQFLVAGRIAGKGSEPLEVYRLSDRTRVLTADAQVNDAIWARTGHQLYLVGFAGYGMHSWTPEAGVASMPGGTWEELAALSPDGKAASYTAFLDPNTQTGLRVYTYDIASGTSRRLSSSPRSQVLFVRDGWVWYLEEQSCTDCMGGSQPTGQVLAMQLSTGTEQPVSFVPGEDPIGEGGNFGALTLQHPEFWPSS